MANIAFTEFLPEVLPSVPGCPTPVAINAIRNAAIDFCASTMYWQETRAAVTLAPADFPYALAAPTGARVIQPLSVINEDTGLPLIPKSIEWLDRNVFMWRDQTHAMPPYYYQPDPNHIVLVPTPDAAVSLVLRVAYCPTRDSTEIEEWVYQNHLEGIAAGAKGRLLAQPGQPWTDAKAAVDCRQTYNTAKNSATIEANKAFTRAAGQVQFRRV